MLRKSIFWTHLATGALGGAIVLMMSVTGVLLTYEMQLNRWALKDYRASPAPGDVPLPVDELLARVVDADPEMAPTSLILRSDPLAPAELSLGRGNYLYADRYTGEILGDGNGRMKRFLRSTMYLHRWFAMEGDRRAVGRAVTGAANLGFLFLVVSGIYLWWPRTWTAAVLRNVTWFRRGLRGKARDFNWHNTLGFWMCIPLFVIVSSGVVISYRWAGNLVYTLTGSEPPARSSEHDRKPEQPLPLRAPAPVSLEEIYQHASAEIPGWQSLSLKLTKSEYEPVVVTLDTSPGRQPAKRTDLTIDRLTCEITARHGFDDLNSGRRLRSWLRFAHTGEVYGIVGQTVAGVASAGAAVLVWTGLALAWRRFFPKTK